MFIKTVKETDCIKYPILEKASQFCTIFYSGYKILLEINRNLSTLNNNMR